MNLTREFKDQFIIEAEEHLETVEAGILKLENDPHDQASYPGILRALHSLKGISGVILSLMDRKGVDKPHYLSTFRDLAHQSESLLQKMRDNPQEAKTGAPILLEGVDLLKILLEDFRRDEAVSRDGTALLLSLRERILGTSPDGPAASLARPQNTVLDDMVQQNLLMIETGLEQLEAGKEPKTVLPLCRRGSQALQLVARRVENPEVKVLISACCALFSPEIHFDPLVHLPLVRSKIADIRLTMSGGKVPEGLPGVVLPEASVGALPEGRDRSLRISQADIDALMNLIGELKVQRNALQVAWDRLDQTPATEAVADGLKPTVDAISLLSEELHRRVMGIRLLPLSLIFSRFPRLVRDLARKLDKEIQLDMQGEGTVIDKGIIDSLSDPLIHMIRNAADHGLESPRERISLGKPSAGHIVIKASNQGQRVVIEVSDDGRGLDSEKIRHKARSLGQVSAERLDGMSEQELFRLLFAPGFSLSEKVSEISGRGVGLDVVLTNLAAIGGEIDIESVPGKGCRFMLQLPLTLAVGKGLLVESGNQSFYLPIDLVVSTLPLSSENLYEFKGREAIAVRQEVMRVYRLDRLLNLQPGQSRSGAKGDDKHLVILEIRKQHLALIVDACHREAEYVVKPLQGMNQGVHGFSGAMITAEGGVILVLDLPALIQRFEAAGQK